MLKQNTSFIRKMPAVANIPHLQYEHKKKVHQEKPDAPHLD